MLGNTDIELIVEVHYFKLSDMKCRTLRCGAIGERDLPPKAAQFNMKI